jgi:hypothetical protein
VRLLGQVRQDGEVLECVRRHYLGIAFRPDFANGDSVAAVMRTTSGCRMATSRLQSGPLSLTNERLETEELVMGDDSARASERAPEDRAVATDNEGELASTPYAIDTAYACQRPDGIGQQVFAVCHPLREVLNGCVANSTYCHEDRCVVTAHSTTRVPQRQGQAC